MIKPKVLFFCSKNSCRTQMAEAFLRDMAGRFEALSAGGEATALDPDSVAVMDEAGLDKSGQTPKKVDLFMRKRVAFLVTLCDREKSARRTVTSRVRDEIRQHVMSFIQEQA